MTNEYDVFHYFTQMEALLAKLRRRKWRPKVWRGGNFIRVYLNARVLKKGEKAYIQWLADQYDPQDVDVQFLDTLMDGSRVYWYDSKGKNLSSTLENMLIEGGLYRRVE